MERSAAAVRRAPVLAVLAASLLSGSCAWTVGDDVLDVVETGTPADAQQQQFLPWLLRDVHLMVGADGAPWIAAPLDAPSPDAVVSPDPSGGLLGAAYLLRIAAPYQANILSAGPGRVTYFAPTPARSVCTYRQGPIDPWLISLRAPDDTGMPVEYITGPLAPLVLCGQRSLAYWQPANDNTVFEVLRREADGRITHRQLAWPSGARPDLQQGPFAFDDREDILFVADADYRTVAYYLDRNLKVDLGVLYWGQSRSGRFVSIDLDGLIYAFDTASARNQPVGFRLGPNGQILGIDEGRGELITCDWDGVRAVALPSPGAPSPVIAPQRVLDPTPCLASGSQLPALTSLVYYSPESDPPGQETRTLRLDSPAPPRTLLRQNGQRILGTCQDRALAYSLDPVDLYGPSVSDGWLGGYRFMERGREVRFPPDCSRVFFKEHAANVRKLGELRSAAVPPIAGADPASLPPPRRLGRNVGFNRVTPDGRLLAMVDLGVVGPENRLLLIDDAAGQAQALLHSLNAVTGVMFVGAVLSDRREVILEVRDSDPGRQAGLLVLTLPPPK